MTAKIDYKELKNYIEHGELSAIPVVCDGEPNHKHRLNHMNTEPDSTSVYCSKCGCIVTFDPLRV